MMSRVRNQYKSLFIYAKKTQQLRDGNFCDITFLCSEREDEFN